MALALMAQLVTCSYIERDTRCFRTALPRVCKLCEYVTVSKNAGIEKDRVDLKFLMENIRK